MSGSAPERFDGVIDHSVLNDIRDLMEDDFLDLVQRFILDAEDLLLQITRGLAEGDMALVYRAAHTLKSSAASLGAMTLSERAKHLEALGRAETSAGADAELADAKAQFILVKEALEQALAGTRD
jgi:HPt (histidine-containing phosphotransfer) domain-containing protein